MEVDRICKLLKQDRLEWILIVLDHWHYDDAILNLGRFNIR
jgi:hypothetical protein